MKLFIITAFATIGLAAMVAASPALGRSRGCGRFRTDGTTMVVTVLRGNVRCRTARHVFSNFFAGEGKLHGPSNGPAYEQSWSIDGWSCGYAAGGGGCISGGRTYKTAREWMVAQAVPRL